MSVVVSNCVFWRAAERMLCVHVFYVGADGISWRAWPVELRVSRMQSDGVSLFTFRQECQQVWAIPCTVQWPCPVYSLLCIVLLVHLVAAPTIASRRHVSNYDCLVGKRENYQNCSVLCCVRQLCTMTHTHTYEQFLQMNVSLDSGLVFVHLFSFSILCVFLV